MERAPIWGRVVCINTKMCRQAGGWRLILPARRIGKSIRLGSQSERSHDDREGGMDPAYLVIGKLLAVGILFGVFRRRRATKRSYGGWIGLGLILLLAAGLVISGFQGSNVATWMFGVGLMVVIPVLFTLAVGSAIGALLGRR